jgi:uncharacterized protein (TIGR03643 family)
MKIKNLPPLSCQKIDQIIAMAWADRVSFDAIERKTQLNEQSVITIMRSQLKPKSFQIWRQRVSGRSTKHEKKFRREQSVISQAI